MVRSLECSECGTQISGRLSRSPFERLNEEQITFLLEFLKSEGNFSELARRMGLSFPTVKARFYSILEVLGVGPSPVEKSDTSAVLDMLERGEITVEDAENLLRGKKAG